ALKRQAIVSAENSFEVIAREWIAAKSPAWTPRYTGFLIKRLENDLFPNLGSRPIRDITPLNCCQWSALLRIVALWILPTVLCSIAGKCLCMGLPLPELTAILQTT